MPPAVSAHSVRGPRAARFARDAGALVVTILLTGLAASRLLRQDSNWDLRNYHFYNAWAFIHGRLGWDLGAAQLQTFHNPLLDLPFYAMVAADWHPRLITFFMVWPAAVGGFFLAKILRLLFREQRGARAWSYPLLAFLVGISACGPVSLLGSTMNDWPGAALIIVALWLLLRRTASGDERWWPLAAAGVLAGVAAGLKLTNAPYAVGLCVALLAQRPFPGRGLRDAIGCGAAVVGGLLVSSGFWMWMLYIRFQNPLFPYFNNIFRSPWWDASRISNDKFGPHTLLGWLTFPLPLLSESDYMSEPLMRDWRLPLIYIAALVAIAAWVLRRARPGPAPAPARPAIGAGEMWRLMLIFWAVSLAVWACMYSIYRYIMPLELLSGAVLIYLLARSVPFRWEPAAAAAACVAAIVTARYPGWGHIDFGERYFSVSVPAVRPDAAVLLFGDEPLSFVLPFLPPDGRFLGAHNNFSSPTRKNRLAEEIMRIVHEHPGPIYSLTTPAGASGVEIGAYGLRRQAGGCASIVSNVSPVPFELCLLERSRSDPDPTHAPAAIGTAR